MILLNSTWFNRKIGAKIRKSLNTGGVKRVHLRDLALKNVKYKMSSSEGITNVLGLFMLKENEGD